MKQFMEFVIHHFKLELQVEKWVPSKKKFNFASSKNENENNNNNKKLSFLQVQKEDFIFFQGFFFCLANTQDRKLDSLKKKQKKKLSFFKKVQFLVLPQKLGCLKKMGL